MRVQRIFEVIVTLDHIARAWVTIVPPIHSEFGIEAVDPFERNSDVTRSVGSVEIPEIRAGYAVARTVKRRTSRVEWQSGDIADGPGVRAIVIARCAGLVIATYRYDAFAFDAGVETSDFDEISLAGCYGESGLRLLTFIVIVAYD